ncbi:MAG: hypothetical protein ACTSUR_08870 [Candidatus Heimdallarchaeaceae archaeon]
MSKKNLFLPMILFVEILLIFFVLYVNIGMFGFDAYIHLQYVESIIKNHKVLEINVAKSYYDFAGFHVFASVISLITGIDSQIVYKYVSVLIPILIFDLTIIAFIRFVEKKKRGYIPYSINIQYFAVVLLYPSIIGIQMILGRPNSLGISLFALCLYLYLCKPDSFRAQLVAAFLAIVTLKIHHLSAVFLLPVILFSSIFLARKYSTILSLVYALPAVVIVETVLNSREFGIVNEYFTQNENYAFLFNLFIKNEYVFLVVWLVITLVGFIIRKRYWKRVSGFFKKHTYVKYAMLGLVAVILVVEIVGLFSYTAALPSWYISAELTILFVLSGLALFPSKAVKNSLFFLGFCFYGFTVVFSLLFSSKEHELSWVAPRTFVFTIIFVSILTFLTVSNVLGSIKRKWLPLFVSFLILNSFFSFSYMANQYLPGYNLTNDLENFTMGDYINSHVNTSLGLSIPFSTAKFISGVDIYRLPPLIISSLSYEENAARLVSPSIFVKYVLIGKTMDQWLDKPFTLSEDEIMFYLSSLYSYIPTFDLIACDGKNFLLYRLF